MRHFVGELEKAGLSVWWDRDIQPGERFDLHIEKAISDAFCVVPVWSASSVQSDWVRWEAHEGLQRDMLMPVSIEDVAPPTEFRLANSISMFGDPAQIQSELERLVEALQKLAASENVQIEASGVAERELVASGPGSDFDSRPSIAVLPFTNQSGDADTDYFVDGLVDELTELLASCRSFPVISGANAVAEGEQADMSELAARLGVKYLLRGSVRRSGSRFRVHVQLHDSMSNRHIWAEKWDREFQDLFQVQDEIVLAILAQLRPAVHESEWEIAERKHPADLNAWDLALRAYVSHRKHTHENILRARELAERAKQLDPSSPFAHATLTATYYLEYFYRWEDPEKSLAEHRRLAFEGLKLQVQDASIYLHVGVAYAHEGNLREAIATLEHALSLNPSDEGVRRMLGQQLLYAGRVNEGIAQLRQQIALTSRTGLTWATDAALSLGYLLIDEFDASIDSARSCLRQYPEFAPCYGYIALSEASKGDQQAAAATIAEAQERCEEAGLGEFMTLISLCESEGVRSDLESKLKQLGVT